MACEVTYRITRIDPKATYRHGPGVPETRHGTRRRVAALIREVRDVNAQRLSISQFYDLPYQPVKIRIERAPVGEWEDVTAEFLKEDG